MFNHYAYPQRAIEVPVPWKLPRKHFAFGNSQVANQVDLDPTGDASTTLRNFEGICPHVAMSIRSMGTYRFASMYCRIGHTPIQLLASLPTFLTFIGPTIEEGDLISLFAFENRTSATDAQAIAEGIEAVNEMVARCIDAGLRVNLVNAPPRTDAQGSLTRIQALNDWAADMASINPRVMLTDAFLVCSAGGNTWKSGYDIAVGTGLPDGIHYSNVALPELANEFVARLKAKGWYAPLPLINMVPYSSTYSADHTATGTNPVVPNGTFTSATANRPTDWNRDITRTSFNITADSPYAGKLLEIQRNTGTGAYATHNVTTTAVPYYFGLYLKDHVATGLTGSFAIHDSVTGEIARIEHSVPEGIVMCERTLTGAARDLNFGLRYTAGPTTSFKMGNLLVHRSSDVL